MKKDFNIIIKLVEELLNNNIEYSEKLAIAEIPELQLLKDTICHHPYHKYEDILEHTLRSLKLVSNYVNEKDNYSAHDIALLRITLLLHDIGKAVSKTTGDDGVDHFYGHPLKSVKMANDILDRYNINENDKQIILKLIKLHDDYIPHNTSEGLNKVINDIGLKEAGMLLKIQRADLNTHSDIYVIRIEPKLDILDELYYKIKKDQD